MVQRVLGYMAALRDHHGHRVAHVPRLVAGEGVLQEALQPLKGTPAHGYDAGLHCLLQVSETEHGHNAGKLQSLRRINGEYPGMGVRAAQYGRVQHSRQLHVVDVTRPPSEKAEVFFAGDGRPDVGSGDHATLPLL